MNLDERGKHAEKLADNATIQIKDNSNKQPIVKVSNPKKSSEVKQEVDLISNLNLSKNTKFSKTSKVTKAFNLRLNLYEKSAIYICSIQDGKSMTRVIEEDTMVNIIKEAERLGLTEKQVEVLVEQGVVK